MPADRETLAETGISTSLVQDKTPVRTLMVKVVAGNSRGTRAALSSRPLVVGAEHDADLTLEDPKVSRRQDRFNPIQKIIGAGCNMNRQIDKLIENAGFEIITLDRFLLPYAPRILAEIYRGVARP